jgi:DNA-binding response OmpR family regulator
MEEAPKVLIVDDEVDICFVLSSMFKSKNVVSDYANTLAEAQLMIKNINPSILILDNQLPDGLGVEFIGYVKRHNPQIKVVMITAHDSPSDKNLAFKNGADYFYRKAFFYFHGKEHDRQFT